MLKRFPFSDVVRDSSKNVYLTEEFDIFSRFMGVSAVIISTTGID